MEVANDCGNSEKIYPSFDINSYLDFLVGLNSPEQKILNSVVVNATLGYLFFFFPKMRTGTLAMGFSLSGDE